MDISIITLNFNTPELTKSLIDSLDKLRNTEGVSFEMILVNLTPEDGLRQLIRDQFSWVKEIVVENRGFAANNNSAIPCAIGRYYLFLNSDTLVPSGTLKEMLNLMDSDPTIGASTCLVELSSGGVDIDCHRGFPTPWASLCYFAGLEKRFPKSKLFGQYHQTWKDFGQTHEINACAGAFMMVRREVIEKIGIWDERFFHYGEDLDMCYRIKQAGWKIVFHPKVKILHYKGASSGIRKESQDVTTATEETRKKVIKSSTEAMEIFYRKNYMNKYPRVISFFILLGIRQMSRLRLRRGTV